VWPKAAFVVRFVGVLGGVYQALAIVEVVAVKEKSAEVVAASVGAHAIE